MIDVRDVNPPSARLKEKAYLSAVEAMPCVHTVFKDDLGIWVYLCDGWHWGQTGVSAIYAETLSKLKAAMHLVAADKLAGTVAEGDMEWSTEKPNKPGYYWATTGDGEMVLNVWVKEDLLYGFMAEWPGHETVISQSAFTHWQGPLTVPEPAKS